MSFQGSSEGSSTGLSAGSFADRYATLTPTSKTLFDRASQVIPAT